MRPLLALLTFCAIATAPSTGAAADLWVYMDRAAEGLRSGLAPIATWKETRRDDEVIFQCRDCSGPVIVVLRHMGDYIQGTGYATPLALYTAGRKQLCSTLVAERRGRCIDAHQSLEDGKRIYECQHDLRPAFTRGICLGA